jgi:hypothetical protein
MGNLATITFYCDNIHEIKKNKVGFADAVYKAICSGGDTNVISSDNFHMQAIVQKVIHADTTTVYVHSGNTVVAMDAYTNDTKELAKNFPEFFSSMVSYMNSEVNRLKKLQKESK